MSKRQKALTMGLWAIVVISMVGVVASGMWARHRDDLPRYYQVPEFSLIDQNGHPLTRADLAGKVWVADFIFTRCYGPCPRMTQKMAQLQQSVADANVKLVTFTVDPNHDTPAVLKEYAATHKADESCWIMATGSAQSIFELAQAMKIPAQPATEDSPITHSEHFLLIDGEGWVRGFYHLTDPEKLSQLAPDARRLAGVRP